ncbi:hypothetical protein AB5N19_08674 [Seiridium cardinale]
MGRKESPERKNGLPEEAPPPYSEGPAGTSSASAVLPQPSTSQTQPKQNYQAGPPVQINRQFPIAFSVYHGSTFSRTYALGEHQAQPLYAISTHTGWSGQPDVVLHSGPSDSSPPLAGVDAGTFSRSATVELPPLPASRLAAAQEPLNFSGFSNGTHGFTIEVGSTGRREPFEWRHSHGTEVDLLGGSSAGWKLIRLATDAPGGEGAGNGAHFVGGGSQSSDGKEVVAVWSNARMSMSKILNFRFLGSGATGVLGERWAVMAVITALRIWDKERKASNGAAAG